MILILINLKFEDMSKNISNLLDSIRFISLFSCLLNSTDISVQSDSNDSDY